MVACQIENITTECQTACAIWRQSTIQQDQKFITAVYESLLKKFISVLDFATNLLHTCLYDNNNITQCPAGAQTCARPFFAAMTLTLAL